MEQIHSNDKSINSDEPRRLARLICKLRWIGLEEEARRLQLAQRLSADRGGVIFIEPGNTD